MKQIDLEYYKTVIRTQNNVEILKSEFTDLIDEIESDPTYRAVIDIISGKEYE